MDTLLGIIYICAMFAGIFVPFGDRLMWRLNHRRWENTP